MDEPANTPSQSEKYSDAALLVIDVQRGLFERSTPLYQAETLLKNINMLMERARRAKAPVVIVQHSNENLLKEDSPDWLLHPALVMHETDLHIRKRHASSFEKTSLKSQLDSLGVKTLVVSGLVSQGCVKAGCLDAVRLGYRVILARDAHSNYHRQAAQIIAEWNEKLSAAGVELRSTDQIDFTGR